MRSLPWFSSLSQFTKSSRIQPGLLLLTAVLSCAFPAALLGQSVTFTGAKPSVNFGNVNLCATGKTTPAPCSETLTLTYRVTASGTLGAINVLTLGSPDLFR